MKSYTDLEQSKNLAEILSIESADMWWSRCTITDFGDGELKVSYAVEPYNISQFRNTKEDIPCWSLAALMNLLPSEFTEKEEYSETTYKIDIRKYVLTENVDIYQIAYGNYRWDEDGSCSWLDMIDSGQKENLLDAAFEMVCWLKENKKI